MEIRRKLKLQSFEALEDLFWCFSLTLCHIARSISAFTSFQIRLRCHYHEVFVTPRHCRQQSCWLICKVSVNALKSASFRASCSCQYQPYFLSHPPPPQKRRRTQFSFFSRTSQGHNALPGPGLEPGSSDSEPSALTTGLLNKAVALARPRYSWPRMLKVAPCKVGRTVARPNVFGVMGYYYFV